MDEQQITIKLKLVRHGETTHNHTQTITGHQPGQLTQLGCHQAQKIGTYFTKNGTPFDFIYVSDLERTKQTFQNACLTAPYLRQIKTVYTPLIRERSGGVLENHPLTIWAQNAEKQGKDIRMYKCAQAESWQDVMDRGQKFLQLLISQHAIKDKSLKMVNILAVSHQGFISEFDNVRRRILGQNVIFERNAKNCSMNDFQISYPTNKDSYSDQSVKIKYVNKNFVGHLEE